MKNTNDILTENDILYADSEVDLEPPYMDWEKIELTKENKHQLPKNTIMAWVIPSKWSKKISKVEKKIALLKEKGATVKGSREDLMILGWLGYQPVT